jgi:polar amino acid transport system substrate-binding protein
MWHFLRLMVLLATCAAMRPAAAVTFLTEENPPMNFIAAGKLQGASVEVVSELAKRAGLAADLVLLPWDVAYGRAQKEPDVCAFSTVRRPERFKLFQWVGPIGRGRYSAFALAGFEPKPTKVDELKPFRIGVVDDARAAYLRQRGFPNLVVAPADAQLPGKLTLDPARGDGIDLWVTRTEGAKQVSRNAGVKEIKEVFADILNQDYWLACNLQMPPEQVRALSGALQEMLRDGTLKKLSDPTRFLAP